MTSIAARPGPATLGSNGHDTRRDTSVDAIRALCLIAVVALHAMMVGISVGPNGPVIENALEGQAWFAPVSWLVQVMPMFFIAGGFSAFTQWQRMTARGASAGDYVRARLDRLLRPAIAMIATVGVGLTALSWFGVSADLVSTAGFRIGQPLWFLAVYIGCSALVPVMIRAHRRARIRTVLFMLIGVATVDLVRSSSGVQAVGYLNLALVWLLVQQLGVWLADGSIDRIPARIRLGLAGVALVLLVALTAGGLYSPDMYVNLNPPTLCMVVLGIAQLFLFSVARPQLRAWMQRRRVATVVDAIGARAMTIYLWHMSVLVTLAGALLASGLPLPHPLSATWWVTRPVWLLAVAVAVIAVVRLVARFETARRPAVGDAAGPGMLTLATLLGVSAVGILLVAGFTPVTAALTLAMMLAAIRLSRRLSFAERSRMVTLSASM